MGFECSTCLSMDINICPNPLTVAGDGDDKNYCSWMAASYNIRNEQLSVWLVTLLHYRNCKLVTKNSPTMPGSGYSLCVSSQRSPNDHHRSLSAWLTSMSCINNSQHVTLSRPIASCWIVQAAYYHWIFFNAIRGGNHVSSRQILWFDTIRPAINKLSLLSSPLTKPMQHYAQTCLASRTWCLFQC